MVLVQNLQMWISQFQQIVMLRKRRLQNLCHKNQKFEIKAFAENARIPVLKMKDNKENVEYDVCCNNILGAINSKLLYEYSNLHENVKKGGILLKIWGKNANIITQNHFSSYAIILMWISFLQNEYNLPNLQDKDYLVKQGSCECIHIRRKTKPSFLDPDEKFETRVNFIVDQEEIRKRMEKCTIDKLNLSDLLFGFWDYYKLGGRHQTRGNTIAIHLNSNEKQEKKFRHIYEILDPFDTPHDPGHRVEKLVKEQQQVLKEFEEAMIQLHSNSKRLFEK